MIKINHSLLSAEALDSLLLEVITRQATDYGEFEIDFEPKKKQLIRKLEKGEVLIVYFSEEGFCDIIPAESIKLDQGILE